MFCEKCGAQLPDNAKFCERCGSAAPVAVSSAAAAAVGSFDGVVSQGAQTYSTEETFGVGSAYTGAVAVSPKKPFFSNKRNLFLVIGIGAVLLLSILLLVVLLLLPKTVVLDDYFTVVYEGCDGYASAVVDWDGEALEEIDEKIFGDSDDSISQFLSLEDCVSITLDHEDRWLSNGDVITLSYEAIEGFEKKYKVKLKLRNDTVTVEGLEAANAVDPLSYVAFSYDGVNGYADLSIDIPQETVKVSSKGYWLRYELQNDAILVDIVNKKDVVKYSLIYAFNRVENLTNGDVVSCTLQSQENMTSELAKEFGIVLSATEWTTTVSNLIEPLVFNPFDYLNITCSGYNGLGEITYGYSGTVYNVGPMNASLYFEVSSYWFKVYFLDDYGDTEYTVRYNLDGNDSNLSNGDVLSYTYSSNNYSWVPGEVAETMGLKLITDKVTCTVSGLTPLVEYDPFAAYTLPVTGFDGYGSLSNQEWEVTDVGPNLCTLRYRIRYGSVYLYVYPKDSSDYDCYVIFNLVYDADENGLSNGDAITLVYDDSGWYDKQDVIYYAGIDLITDDKVLTVTGLQETTNVSLEGCVVISHTGYSTVGTNSIIVMRPEVTAGDYTIAISASTTGNDRIYFEVKDAEGNVKYSFYFYPDKTKNLTNGDTVTWKTTANYKTLGSQYGIHLTTEPEMQKPVYLMEPKPVAVFDHVSVGFEGFEGYGNITMTVTEDVYTVGSYSIKLTPTFVLDGWSSKCYITVVVADAQGTNLFTTEYRAGNYRNIAANGEITTFTCSASKSQREEWTRQYGILFEEKKEYTVSGLTPLTPVDPREKLTYRFAGENGSIVMTPELGESSYTVGGYTINLSVVMGQGWSSNEAHLIFKVVETATGVEVASGKYYCYNTGLYEGGSVYLRDSFEQDTIAKTTGLLFSREEPAIIVSAK